MSLHRQIDVVVAVHRSSSMRHPQTIHKQDLDARNCRSQAFSHRTEYVDVYRSGYNEVSSVRTIPEMHLMNFQVVVYA